MANKETTPYLVEAAHGGGGGRNDIVDEEEESVLRPEADPLPDEEVKLANCQVRGNEVFLLVQVSDPRLGRLLHDNGHAIRILPSDLLALGPPLLERMLLLVLPLHVGIGVCCCLDWADNWLLRCCTAVPPANCAVLPRPGPPAPPLN